jgi:vancomycin resistance protein YoaR
MMKKIKQTKKINEKKQPDLLLVFLILVALISTLFFAVISFNPDKIYGNVSVVGVDVSYANREEARELIRARVNEYEGIVFEDKRISPYDIGIYYDIEKTVDQAFLIGRNPNILLGIKERLVLGFFQKNILLEITTDEKLDNFLTSSSNKLNQPVGRSLIAWDNGLKYIPGENGQRLMIAETKKAILKNATHLEAEDSLKIKSIEPAVVLSDKEFMALEKKVRDPLVLRYKESVWKITPQEMISWIRLENKEVESASYALWLLDETSIKTSVDEQEVGYFVSKFASEIDVPKKNALLKIEDGRAVAFSLERDGLELDQSDTVEKIAKAINSTDKREVNLRVLTHKPEIREDNIGQLGINENIGVGYSNFEGSTKNRIHNIRTGASKFNGVIVKPGEEFSFNSILGPVDASTGYAPELVILRDKTVPEYGGGLCQVSSTAFRAALNSGLTILERYNHAYPVRYYAPYGTDATIYLPKPDFRFKNDTSSHILIQTSISGSTLKFEFYGTKTGKEVKFSGNSNGLGSVANVENVSPYIYDKDLRGPGSFKSVWYRFIYENGNLIKTDKFFSNYDSPDKYPKPDSQVQ